MAWIESHQALRSHPKTLRLARELQVSRASAIGHLQCVWWWALDYAPDGNLSRHEALDIAIGAEWDGEPDVFLSALRASRFLDEDGRLHDWEQYTAGLQASQEAAKLGNHTRWHVKRGIVEPGCSLCVGGESGASRGDDPTTSPPIPPTRPTNQTQPDLPDQDQERRSLVPETVRKYVGVLAAMGPAFDHPAEKYIEIAAVYEFSPSDAGPLLYEMWDWLNRHPAEVKGTRDGIRRWRNWLKNAVKFAERDAAQDDEPDPEAERLAALPDKLEAAIRTEVDDWPVDVDDVGELVTRTLERFPDGPITDLVLRARWIAEGH